MNTVMHMSEFMKAYCRFYESTLKKMKKNDPSVQDIDVTWKIVRSWQNLSKEEQDKYKRNKK